MQSFRGCVRIILQKQSSSASMSSRCYSLSDSTVLSHVGCASTKIDACPTGSLNTRFFGSIPQFFSHSPVSAEGECKTNFLHSPLVVSSFTTRYFATTGQSTESPSPASSASDVNPPTRIKFKRPDKTAKHIMQILDREAVEEVKKQREIPDIKPGYIVQLKVEVPENKRRVSTLKGIVIARRNAGLNTTFRIRRLVAGVGVESLFPLYSPNIKEIKVLDKKKVRRAKLYYLRDKMNALKRQ